MGARSPKATAVELVINAREPALGVGVHVRSDSERATYKFVNGGERSFKHEYCRLYIKPAVNVPLEVRQRLVPPPPPPKPKPAPAVPVTIVAQHRDPALEKAILANLDAD